MDEINIGDVFGNWVVIGEEEKIGHNIKRKCQCQCENKTIRFVDEYRLINGTSKSCGCIRGDWQKIKPIFKNMSFKTWCLENDEIEYLELRKSYDEYKKQYAINNNYYYLGIPYTYEKNDKYKELINNKINEITQAELRTA